MSLIFTNIASALLFLMCSVLPQQDVKQTDKKIQGDQLEGAWKLVSGATPFANLPQGTTAVAMLEDGYFTVTYFNKADKQFVGTYGGTYSAKNGKLIQKYEYNTLDSATAGTSDSLTYMLIDGKLQVESANKSKKLEQVWRKADNGSQETPLEGTWRITGRAGEDGKINQMRRGPRKTLKILSDGRFQWIAFNTETKEFSGTGGGTYTAENGSYTENIEFFSRDPNRVGASLNFNYEVQDGKWHHTGKSSSGKDIHEVWERELKQNN